MTKDKFVYEWDKMPVVLDIGYAAALFKLSEERIRQLCANGTLPAFKVGGSWRMNRADLMTFCNVKSV